MVFLLPEKLDKEQALFDNALKEAAINAKKEEKIDMGRTMKLDNEPIGKIIKYTGLSQEEIDNL